MTLTATTGTLTFAAGETSKTVTVPVKLDALSPETGEGVTLTLSSPSTGTAVATTPSATVSFTDVPLTYALTASAASVYEGAGITYTLTASAPVAVDTVVDFSVVPGDAAAGDQGTSNTNLNDFAAGAFNPTSVTIKAGATTATYGVTSSTDTKTELPETYTVKAVSGTATLATKSTTLLDGTGADVGKTYTLTTGVDSGASFVGTASNDTYDALATTLTALDSLDGAGGTDVLNVSDVNAAGAQTYTVPASVTMANIETLNVTVASDNVGDTLTADVSAWTGLKTVNATISGTDAPITLVTTKGNVTAATLSGSTTGAITDSATTDTLATVTAVENAGLVTVTSDALTALNLKTSAGGATVVAAAATRALAVNLDGVTAGTVTDAQATTLNVTSSGTKTTGVTLTTVKATTVTIDAAVATTITDVNIDAATKLTTKGAGAITVSATTTVTALTEIDASASTGGTAVSPAAGIGTGVKFTGGTGADSVSIAATTKAIVMGDGNDTVTVVGVSALGAGGSVDAGAGTGDTLKFSTYANAVTASAATTFEGTVSNFEKVELSGVNAAAAAAIDLANLDDISYVTLSATNTETTTISNMGANGTIAFTASQTTAKPVTLTLANSTGVSDVLNVVLSKDTATALVGLTAAGVETINVTSTETATTLLGTVTHGVQALVIADAKTLNISGNAGVTITTLTGTAMTNIDASGVSTGLVSFTTGALAAAATIKGGADANTIVATAATKAVTFTGGAKVDTITIDNAQANVISTGAGNDVIVVGSGANTITAGDGDDSITIGASAGLNTVNVGAGTDTVKLAAIQTAAGYYTSITGMTAGDKINVADVTTAVSTVSPLGAKMTLGAASSFANYLDAAAASATGAGTAAVIKWFQFTDGNTYIVVDNSDTTTFADGVDSVIQLVGVVDLSTSTVAADIITLV
jgi:S-layer protein